MKAYFFIARVRHEADSSAGRMQASAAELRLLALRHPELLDEATRMENEAECVALGLYGAGVACTNYNGKED